MKIQRRDILLGAMAAGLGAATRAQTPVPVAQKPMKGAKPEPNETIDLWPDGAPGMPANPPVEETAERSSDSEQLDRFVVGVTKPRLVVFRPAKPNGAAIMITPGGAYKRIVIDNEGYDLGRLFSEQGFTVFILFYRLPGDGWAAGPNVSLSDAQRGIRIIRSRASDFGIDPQRIAAMCFSAGGHLCADLATRFATPTYDAVDSADQLSARPMLAAPVYPVISMSLPVTHAVSRDFLLGENPSKELERAHSPQHNVPADAPPCFLVHAQDDMSVVVENTLEFYSGLKAAGIPVEMHLFTHGGHGFGIRKVTDKPAHIWPELFVNWSQSMGLI